MKTRLLTILLLSVSAFGTTPVTGHIANLNTGTPGTSGFVRFILGGMGGNQPRITGTGAIAPLQGGNGLFYVDLPADASGNISGTIYSTRDAAGTGNGEIEVGGSYTAVYYRMFVYNNGIPGPEIRVHANNGVTLDISNVTPISTTPVVTAPTGDTTYCRIDGGNCGLTGPITSTSSISAHDFIPSSTPVVDVRSKGAKCDGVADDTTAVQAAVTAANSIGGVVFIPPSLLGCGISATIISSSTAPVGIVGVGQGFSSLKALSTIAGPMFEKLDGFVGGRGLIQGVNFNCNQHAAESLLIESHRQLDMRDVGSQDCTSENEILGKTGATNLVGLQAYNLNIDNTAIATANLASRPTYGLDLKNNVDDSEVNTLLVNHTQTAGMKIAGVNNHFVKIHPWGYGPSGTIPNSWPTYGIEVTGQENSFEGCEPDNIHTAGFKQSASRLVITGCTFGNGEAGNTPYMVEADAGTDTLILHSNTLTGNWQGPVNFLGSIGANTYAFSNGFLTQTYFPSGIIFQGLTIKNAADANLLPVCDSGSTASEQCAWSFKDRGTEKWQVGKFGSNDFRIRSVADSLDIFQAFGGSTVSLSAPSGQVLAFNIQTGSSAAGASFYSGGGSPAVVATISGSGRGTFNGGEQIGSAGSVINGVFGGSATLTYTGISAQTCQEQTLTVTGATSGKPAQASPTATLGNTNLSWSAWTSATNTVSVRVCNPSAGSITPSAVVWQAWVQQ